MGKFIQSLGQRDFNCLKMEWSIELTSAETFPLNIKKKLQYFFFKIQLRKDLKQTSKLSELCDVTYKCEQLKQSNKELLANTKKMETCEIVVRVL